MYMQLLVFHIYLTKGVWSPKIELKDLDLVE